MKGSDFKSGDLVVLRSGSPPIVIVAIDGDTLMLQAFNRDGDMIEFGLPASCVGPYMGPRSLA